VFGLGVLRHLAARGHHYDVVHTASFPYFSLLAAGLVRSVRGFRIVVDWHEVWTRDYWREYLGAPLDRIGWSVQKLCLRIPQHAFCFSHLHERRLHGQGVAGPVTVLTGQYDGPTDLLMRPAEPLVVFAGRHIPEKRAPAVVPAVARALTEVPGLRAIIYGDGPDRPKVLELIRALGLEDIVEAPGFVDGDEIDQALGRALCLVLPSRREGYGRVVVEALARGTPVVVTAGPDNAAVELVEDRANGFVAPSGRPDDLAEAILRVRRAGDELRRSTAEWYRRHAEELSLEGSLEVVTATYREPAD
jgi:glycosyltransferase involved in cell wall biosynthesis